MELVKELLLVIYTNDTWGIALGQANSTYEINTGNAPSKNLAEYG
jgi:hypothetical protein